MPLPDDLRGRHLGDSPRSLGDPLDFFRRQTVNPVADALRAALTPAPPLQPRDDTIEAAGMPVTAGRMVESVHRNINERVEGVQGLAQLMAQLPDMTSPQVLNTLKSMRDQLMVQAAQNLTGVLTRGAEFLESELRRDPAGPAFEAAEFLPIGRLGKFKKVGSKNLWELTEGEAVTYATQAHSQVNRVARTATDKRIGHLKGKMPKEEYRKLSRTVYADEYDRAIRKAKKVTDSRLADYNEAVKLAREEGVLAVPTQRPLSEVVKDPVKVPEFEGFTRHADNIDKPDQGIKSGAFKTARQQKTGQRIEEFPRPIVHIAPQGRYAKGIGREGVYIRFGRVPTDKSGKQVPSGVFDPSGRVGTEAGVSVHRAIRDPKTGKYVVESGGESLIAGQGDAGHREIFQVTGKGVSGRQGSDFEDLLEPGTIRVENKISPDDIVLEAEPRITLSGRQLDESQIPRFREFGDELEMTPSGVKKMDPGVEKFVRGLLVQGKPKDHIVRAIQKKLPGISLLKSEDIIDFVKRKKR